jgi:tRNA-2-methylthio-N6-dimethylallyladenosine synthase
LKRTQRPPLSASAYADQSYYIQIQRNLNAQFEVDHDRKRRFMIMTYGCQMNEHDSEKLTGMLGEMGYVEALKKEDADLIIFNTCCVRENAELRVYGNLGALKPLKKKNPDLRIVVCGCMMQQPHVVEEIKAKYAHVSLVFGTHNLHQFPHLLSQTYTSSHLLVDVWDSEGEVIEGLPVTRKVGIKAYVNIMYGCNNFCTYCIVPYTRGRERSRTPESIVREIEGLVRDGAKEVTLLGQNVNSYGRGLEPSAESTGEGFEAVKDFPSLLERVSQIEGLKRIRFMTSHPKDISDELIEVMARCENICEYLHLPVQSGSDQVLKAMNRHYTKGQYLDILERARKRIPGLAVTTDIIVGFPGETEADHEETMSLIEQARYDSAFTFMYSIRTGTPAAEREDQVPEDVKHARFDRMLKRMNEIVIEKNKVHVGETYEVLVEQQGKDGEGTLIGRTRHNHLVAFEGPLDLVGAFAMVKITKSKNFSLVGDIVEVLA